MLLGLTIAQVAGYRQSHETGADEPARDAGSAGHQPLDVIPADHLLCWNGSPFPDTRPPGSGPSTPSALGTLLDLGTRMAGRPDDASTQLTLRGAEAISLLVRYPHAVALLDASARPLEDNPAEQRVDGLKIIVAVRCGDDGDAFPRLVQKVVNEQTDAGFATLGEKTAGKWSYHELRDNRLPAWAVFGWGRIGDLFVWTLGEDVWRLAAATAAKAQPSAAIDPWVRKARSARPNALVEILATHEAIRRRLDPVVHGRATEFFAEWGAADVERSLWSLGFERGAMFMQAHFLRGGETSTRVYAESREPPAGLRATIPDGARFAVYRLPLGRMLQQLVSSLVVTREAEYRRLASGWWQKVEDEGGFSAERDLFGHLGETAVLHNFPPHPLRLPLAFTLLLEIRDEPQTVRKTLDAIGEAVAAFLEESAAKSNRANLVTLQNDGEAWFLQIGPVSGVAWTVTDRFIVASWSPRALREYLDRAGEAVK
jgi:hypothetical protein